MKQKFFAVRVVITWQYGGSTERDYPRFNSRMSRNDWQSFAVGDLIRLVTGWEPIIANEIKSIEIYEITEKEMRK